VTDRHSGYIVTLEQEVRKDDAEAIIAAIGMIKGVLTVDAVVADASTYIERRRARSQIINKLIDIADEWA
jgi:hypothetical protein